MKVLAPPAEEQIRSGARSMNRHGKNKFKETKTPRAYASGSLNATQKHECEFAVFKICLRILDKFFVADFRDDDFHFYPLRATFDLIALLFFVP